MRKEEIASLVVYLLMIALAVIVGLSVITNAMSALSPRNFNSFGFVIITIVVGLLFNIVMLEVLHAIGAKIGGYKVVLINILGFNFEKKNNKWTFKFKDFDGLTGQTKIAPNKEKLSLKPYIWLPLFGYAAELAGGIVLYTYMMQNQNLDCKWLGVCGILFVVLSSMIALYNLVPLKLDSTTDGYRLVLISKPANIEAINELLKMEDLQRNGEEVNEFKVFNEITEYTAGINLFAVYKKLDDGKYDEAEEIVDMMLKEEKKLEPSTYMRLIAQKMYIVLLNKEKEEAKKVYDELADDKVRRYIANDLSMESLRAYMLISGVLEKSQGELKYALSRKTKALKRSLQSRAVIEEKLFNIALDKIYTIHPEWKEVKENTAA